MLDIQLLGPLQFQFDGNPLPDPPRRSVTELLLYLLLNRKQALTRDHVAFAIWPDATESVARGNLRRQLHNLLQYLPATPPDASWVNRDGHRLQWNAASGYALDVERFDLLFDRWQAGADDLAHDRAIALLAEAAALYRGDLCAGFDAEWLYDLRNHIRSRYERLLDVLGTLYVQGGAFAQALAVARTRYDLDRLSENAHRLLVWVHYASGDRMAALQQFEAYQKLMHDELGAEAQPEMVALRDAIRGLRPLDEVERLAVLGTDAAGRTIADRRGQQVARQATRSEPPPDALPAPQHNLPRELAPLLGREADLDAIIQRLERQPLVTITSFGGMGKTRLALSVAHRLVDQYRDGVWWIDLAPLSDSAMVVYELAVLFGVRARSSSAVTDSLLTALANKTALLVLDNCEHLIEASATLVRKILRHCPRVRILTTSTERLGLGGEVLWTVQPLGFPQDVSESARSDAAILSYPAIRLFVARAQDVRPETVFDAEALKTIGAICRRLDGMPLAIELAAARTRVLSVDEIAARLDDSLSLLSSGPETDNVRHRALRSTIEWSFALLDRNDQILLESLAVFSGGCSLDAVQAVAAVSSDRTPQEVLDALDRLVDRSLVVVHAGDAGEMRFGLLETIRQFGEQHLRERADHANLQHRHAAFYAALATRARPELTGEGAARWRAVLEEENDNFRTALAWSLDSGTLSIGLTLGAELWRFWYLRGSINEGSDWLAQLLEAAATVPPSAALAEALRGAGVLADARNEYGQARVLYDQSLKMYQLLRDNRGAAAVLDHLSVLMQVTDELDFAEAFAAESLRIKRALGDEPAIAVALRLLAGVVSARGKTELASRLLQESLAIQRGTGSRPYDLALTLQALGGTLIELGALDEAEAAIEEAWVIFRDLRDQINVARCLNDLGRIELERDNFAAACQHYAESLAWARRHGHQQLALWQLYDLGLAYREWGKLEATQRFAREALEMARSLDDPVRRIRALGLLVDVAIEQSDLIAARVYSREMLQLADELEQSFSIGLACAAAGDLAVAERRYAEASEHLLRELAICEDLADAYYLLEALDRWVVLLAATRAFDQALRLLAAVNHLRYSHKVRRQPFYARRMAPVVETAKAEAGPVLALAAHRQGAGLSLAEAIVLVRDAAEQHSAIA